MKHNNTIDYYDQHWTSYADNPYAEVKTKKAASFFSPIIHKLINETKVLDVGCGDGVHWNYLKRIKNLPINFSGVDISEQAVNYLKRVADKEDGTFFVMDACNLNFPDNYFDMVFAYGVIGYADNPQGALQEMHRVCKKGGWIGVFSPDIKGISKTILFAVRSIAKLLGNRGKRILANLLVPFFGLAPSETQITLKNASWRQVCEVILTNIAPPKLEVIKYQKMINWFDELKITINFDNTEVKTILWELKSK